MMLKQTKHNLIPKVVTSLAVAIAMNIAYPAVFTNHSLEAIAAEDTPISAEAKQVIERLTGQWQLTPAVNNSDPLNFIFTADGKLYIVNTNQKSAFAFEYQVNITNGQTYLDVLQGSFASRITVDFSQKGQLILQQLFVPAAFQYSDNIFGGFFLPNSLFLNRISNDTNLPKDIEITSPQVRSYPIKQSEAKNYVGTLNRAQQAFFLEKNYFTSKLVDLGSGIIPETENYKYQIVVLNSTKAVQNIGLAKKDGLKSYTGLVYVSQTPNSPEAYTFAIMCASLKPTRQMPPKFVLQPEPECPSGYEKI